MTLSLPTLMTFCIDKNLRVFKRYFIAIIFCILPTTAFAQDYDLEEISVTPYNHVIHRTGVLDFKRTTHLSFKSSGFLKLLLKDESDTFTEKQLIASLNTLELKALKNSAYARLLQAKSDVIRVSTLVERKVSSEQSLEVAKTNVATSRSDYKIAYYNLEQAEIIAPFTGVVLSRHTEVGELQTPGSKVLTVASLSNNVVVRVALPGKEVSQVKVGQLVKVILQNSDVVIGTIKKIPVVADVDNHLFEIEVMLPVIEFVNGAIAGQIAEVLIDVSSNQMVYRIPIDALVGVDLEGNALLMIMSVTDNKISQQAFTILTLDNDYLYLPAAGSSGSLNVVTRGWQKLSSVEP